LLLGFSHGVVSVQALSPVDDYGEFGDQGLSPADHVGEDSGHLAQLPARATPRLLLEYAESYKIFWMYFGVSSEELGKLGIGICPKQFRGAPGGMTSLSK